MHDVGVVKTSWHCQRPQGTAGRSLDANEQTVCRVLDEEVVVNVRTHASEIGGEGPVRLEFGRVEVRLLKAIGRRRHRGVGTMHDDVVRDGGPRLDDLNRIDNLLDRIHDHIAATTVENLGVVDVVQKDPLILQVGPRLGAVDIGTHNDATPVPSGGHCGWLERIPSAGLVQPRRKDDTALGRPHDLDRAAAAVHGQ